MATLGNSSLKGNSQIIIGLIGFTSSGAWLLMYGEGGVRDQGVDSSFNSDESDD